ncbi:DDE-type integrase/transposase/recombinase, partial [Streptomyces niveiscabiei]|uniref:DDE-type integrase/transposase/recombinase n=1 Tax=Streptomyces niveiscabiei TaxID=164115 RepID=UPI0038F60197
MDLIGPLPPTPRGNHFVVVGVDAATKWVEAEAITNKRAATIRSWLYTNIICRYGAPEEIVTDNGKEFCRDFKNMLADLKIRHRHTSQYHPQTN